MMIIESLKQAFQEAISSLFSSHLTHFPELVQPDVERATQAKFGHYQCNSALKLAKALKRPPRQIAQEIVAALRSPCIHKIEIVDPGFINLTLDQRFLASAVEQLLHDENLGVSLPIHKQRIIVEFSSPNIAKELHVGHLRSTIIGDSLAKLFEFLGHDVLRLNHIGDWGTQFGMLIAYIQEVKPQVFTSQRKADLEELMQWYRSSKKQFDEDPLFQKKAQLQVVRLQGGDEASLEAWEMVCDISRRAFEEIYRLLDVTLIERGESFYNSYLAEIVADLDKKELITISHGAKCIFLEGFTARDGSPLPVIVQKSDGGYNYETTDIAGMRHRIEQEKADRIIVVTDAGQILHFQQVVRVCEKAGYLDPTKVRFDHVAFGVVLGSDGKKFKTRSGETERLLDLIYEAITRAKEIFRNRLPSEEEIGKLGKILGIDAIKYADLSCHRLKDYQFSYERMLRFEGNTAAFILYAYVRIQGIKRKVAHPIDFTASIVLEDSAEIALALHLLQFGETLHTMAEELLPNRLCEYLYELTEKFNVFFRDCRVEGSEQEGSRLLLCEATRRILEKGLDLLGLKTLSRM